MTQFNGKTYIITGAAGALGRVVSRTFAAHGASLILWDINADRLHTLADDIGGNTRTQVVNITDVSAVQEALSDVGKIDGLVHIAGGFAMPGPVHDGHFDVWDKMMTLNAKATYITAGQVAAHMLKQDSSGSISMIAARTGLQGGKHNAAYAASKSAVLRIMESMAEELKPHGIRVNAVSPSIIDTPANREAMGDKNAHKWVKPEEIAETLRFLASDNASAITGANIPVYKLA